MASGTPSNLRFSPDGSKLMYSRSNGVEIFDMATHTTAAVAHTGASDATPVWSPDGTQIAFRRTVSGQPWAIWVADAATLTPRQVWQAAAGLGSSYYSLDQNPTFESRPATSSSGPTTARSPSCGRSTAGATCTRSPRPAAPRRC